MATAKRASRFDMMTEERVWDRPEREDGREREALRTSNGMNKQEDWCLQLPCFIDDIQSVALHLSHHCRCGAVTATHQVMAEGAEVASGYVGWQLGMDKRRGSEWMNNCVFVCWQMTNNELWRKGNVYSKREKKREMSCSAGFLPQYSPIFSRSRRLWSLPTHWYVTDSIN